MSFLKDTDDKFKLSYELYGIESVLQHCGVVQASFGGSSPVLRFQQNGKGNKENILKNLTSLFGSYKSLQESDDDKQYIFTDNLSYLCVTTNYNKKQDIYHINFDLVTTHQETLDKLKDISKTMLQEKPASNSVLALTNTPNGLALTSLGEINQELLTCNYDSTVIKGYEHVKSCLASKEPCGRLVLFQGAPGTGKSYMIRSLVSTIDSTFIIVGSNMIADLSGPTILPVLLNSVEHDEKPITFILEDADVALSDRKSSHMSQLSGLLNLGDGLLGEMLDIRIVATTNASKLELDKAITRPGRMCQNITFNALNADDASSLYSKLVGGTKAVAVITNKPRTLAEVYRMARRDGWVPPKAVEIQGTYV